MVGLNRKIGIAERVGRIVLFPLHFLEFAFHHAINKRAENARANQRKREDDESRQQYLLTQQQRKEEQRLARLEAQKEREELQRQEAESRKKRNLFVAYFMDVVEQFPSNLFGQASFFEVTKPRLGIFRLASLPDTESFETPKAVLRQLPICSLRPACWSPLSRDFDGVELEAETFLSMRDEEYPVDLACLEFEIQLTDRMMKEWKDSWRFVANKINECDIDRQRQYWEELSDICRNIFGQIAAEHRWLENLVTEYRRSASANKPITRAELAERFPLELPTLKLEAASKESPRERAIAEARAKITERIIADAKAMQSMPTEGEINENIESDLRRWLENNEHELPR